ncbi:MAG: nucleotidyltransferase family protein [Euryarchaeota archaeon]|nr:nucleotidyltransferase family protein [Euryarchaeota archaeon]
MDEKIKEIVEMLKRHGAKEIKIFGSYVRDEAREDSDLDVLVEFSGRKSLLDLVGIEQELEEALGIKVDLLTRKSISPYLIDRIEKEAVVVFGR